MTGGFVTLLDFIGTFVFAISGGVTAVRRRMDIFGVLVLAFATATFGGILRDILSNRLPQVLRHELYASVSLMVALLYLSLRHLGVDEDLNLLASFTAGLALRLAAIRWHWSLPVFSYAPGRWNG